MSKRSLLVSVSVLALSGCFPIVNPVAPERPMTAPAYCASRYQPNGFGSAFYCPSSQGNLQNENFPDGSRGYCMLADENLGQFGYSVTTYNGGAYFVMSQSRASALTQSLGAQSPGYVRCTRD